MKTKKEQDDDKLMVITLLKCNYAKDLFICYQVYKHNGTSYSKVFMIPTIILLYIFAHLVILLVIVRIVAR